MKNRLYLIILASLITGVLTVGCGAQKEEAAAQSPAEPAQSAEASEETPEEAPAEEAEEEDIPMDDSENIDYPEDFVEQQSGILEFADFDEVIAALQDGQGYAYLTAYGSDKTILAVTETVFEADHSTNDATFYTQDATRARSMGVIAGNGSAYPLRIDDQGIIYSGDNHTYETSFLSPAGDTVGIMQKDYIYQKDDGSFDGFTREDDSSFDTTDFTGGQAEFDELIEKREALPVIEFTIVGDGALEGGDESTSNAGELPAYTYTGSDAKLGAVSEYIATELRKQYDAKDNEVSIPVILEVATDDSKDDDIKVYGDFWIYNYSKDGNILSSTSGGNYPGVIHLKKDGDNLTVTKMDIVEDGSDFDKSAKDLFGDHYDDFMKVYSDDKGVEKARGQAIADYVKANGLDITSYQDYGWDPVELPL